MATKNVNSTGNPGQISQDDDLYPDMIIEEDFVDVYITDDDTDDSDYPAGTSAQPAGQAAGNKTQKVSAGTEKTDTTASKSHAAGSKNQAAGSKGRATDIKSSADADKKKTTDDKKKKDPDAGDGLSIEDIDDEVVAQTNQLIKEKKKARKGDCGCGC